MPFNFAFCLPHECASFPPLPAPQSPPTLTLSAQPWTDLSNLLTPPIVPPYKNTDFGYLNPYNDQPTTVGLANTLNTKINEGHLPTLMFFPVYSLLSTPDHNPFLASHISELVHIHGCIRESLHCARQLKNYWVPTLPAALRGCNIDAVMRECLRLGRRAYDSRDKRRLADDKWQSYCAAREARERWVTYHAKEGSTYTTSTYTTPTPAVSAAYSFSLPPPPPPPAPSQLQQLQHHRQQAPNCLHERQMYVVMAAYKDLQHEHIDIMGVIQQAPIL